MPSSNADDAIFISQKASPGVDGGIYVCFDKPKSVVLKNSAGENDANCDSIRAHQSLELFNHNQIRGSPPNSVSFVVSSSDKNENYQEISDEVDLGHFSISGIGDGSHEMKIFQIPEGSVGKLPKSSRDTICILDPLVQNLERANEKVTDTGNSGALGDQINTANPSTIEVVSDGLCRAKDDHEYSMDIDAPSIESLVENWHTLK